MPWPPPSTLPDTPFPNRPVAAVAAVAEALLTPAYWTLDRLLALQPTTDQRSRWRRWRGGHFLAVAIRVLVAPALVLALVLALLPAVLGLLLWLPAQAERRPFVHQFSAAAATPEPWDPRCPRGLTFLTANVCLLPSGLARFSNLGGTGRRAEVIGRILAAAERSGDRDGLLDSWSGRGGGYGGTLSTGVGPGGVDEGSAVVSSTAWPEMAMGDPTPMVNPTKMVNPTSMVNPTLMGDPTPMVNATAWPEMAMGDPSSMVSVTMWPEMKVADPTPMVNPAKMVNPTWMGDPTPMVNPTLMTNTMAWPEMEMADPSLMTSSTPMTTPTPMVSTVAWPERSMGDPSAMTNPTPMTNTTAWPEIPMGDPSTMTNSTMTNSTMTNSTMTNPTAMTNTMAWPEIPMGDPTAMTNSTLMSNSTTMTNSTSMTNSTPMTNSTMTNPTPMTNAITNPTAMTNSTLMTNPSPMTNSTPMANPAMMTSPTMTNSTMTNPTMTNPTPMTNPAMTNPTMMTNSTMTNPTPMANPAMMTNSTMTNSTMTNPTMTNPTPMTNPTMTNPTMTNPTMTNPTMTNPTMTNPTPMANPTSMTNPTMTNPTMTNPSPMTNPSMMTNPTMTNPTMMINPTMTNSTMTNPTLTNPSPTTNPTPRPECPDRPERPISLPDPMPPVLTARIPPDVDFLCLQEVFDVTAATALRRHLGRRFPHLLWGVGPAGLRRGRLRLMGSGLLLASRFPLLTASFWPFPQAAREDALANKGLLVAQVLLGTGRGRRVVGYLGCTHLQATAADATIRDAQLSLSLRWLKDFRRQQEQPGDLVAFDVLCGDLNFDNCSRGDAQNQCHPLFQEFWDPARRDRGQEQPWAIGTLLNYLKIYEEPVSDPETMRRTLSEPWGRQQFLAGPILSCGVTDPSVTEPWSGRRVDMVLLRRDPEVTTEVTRYSVITRLATLSDHLPVAVRLRLGPADH